jgi:hypothetical protein
VPAGGGGWGSPTDWTYTGKWVLCLNGRANNPGDATASIHPERHGDGLRQRALHPRRLGGTLSSRAADARTPAEAIVIVGQECGGPSAVMCRSHDGDPSAGDVDGKRLVIG